MQLGLDGRTALITGAGRGLGSSVARVLAREGVRVLLVSRDGSALERTVASLEGDEDHQALATDLENPESADEVLSWLDKLETPIDIVINNVGGTMSVDDPLASWSDFQRVLNLNLGIAVELNRALIPGMQYRGWGRICHVSSVSAVENHGPPAYCAAKAGLNAYVRAVGRAVSPSNVILTGIMPGAILTDGGYWDVASRERPEHVERFVVDRMAIGRFGTESEIAEATAFLVSEQASFLVGSILMADGGQGRSFHS